MTMTINHFTFIIMMSPSSSTRREDQSPNTVVLMPQKDKKFQHICGQVKDAVILD